MSGISVLLITANVGSIFEEPGEMMKMWTEEFLSTVSRLDPKFIALHCQEVGGKNYEQSMRHVQDFVRLLMSSEELRLFDKVRIFLDEDFSSAEHFTALGNFYFVHESLKDVLLWDFKECKFVSLNDKKIHSGNIEQVTTKEKAKFPQDFFPECKWSRKGFLRTRWSIDGTSFDLINIHLFHDASNFVAMETFPSVYSKTRRRALEHTLERFHKDHYPNVPYFLFGDFNFRTDTAGVIKKLTQDTHESKLSSKGSISKLQFRNKEDNLILSLGKKEFSHREHRNVFVENSGRWLQEYDRELEDFQGRLFEFPIEFIPSYPFEEDVNQGSNYMQTRVPAWCDRILLSPLAKSLIQDISSSNATEYGIIGPTTCMGDHKPVYLQAIIASDAGMINCCTTKYPEMCFQVPENYLDLLSMLPDTRSNFLYSSLRSIGGDRYLSSKLLHAIPIEHDPYTPDSMDSPSPNTFVTTSETDVQDCENNQSINNNNKNSNKNSNNNSSNNNNNNKNNNNHNNSNNNNNNDDSTSSSRPVRLDMAVSPTLLKSKLEIIIKNEELAKRERTIHLNKNQSYSHNELLNNKLMHSWPEIIKCDNYLKRYNSSDCFLYNNYNNNNINRKNNNNSSSSASNKKSWSWNKYNNKEFKSSTCQSSPIEKTNDLKQLIIPKITIINPSNFQSNESCVNFQDDRLFINNNNNSCSGSSSSNNFNILERRRKLSKDLSSEDISLELDISDKKCIDKKQLGQDSGIDTLDIDDGFSHGGGSLGLSSNETTSTLPLDFDKDLSTADEISPSNKLIIDNVDIKIENNNDTRRISIDSLNFPLMLNKDNTSTTKQLNYSIQDNNHQKNNRLKKYRVTQKKCQSCCSCCVIS